MRMQVHTCPPSWRQSRVTVHSFGLIPQRPEFNIQRCRLKLCFCGPETTSRLSHLDCQMGIKIALPLKCYSLSSLLLKVYLAIWHCAKHCELHVKMQCLACVKNKAGFCLFCSLLQAQYLEQ